MAQGGQAPRFLGWTSKRGVPVFAIVLTNLFGALSMMNVSTGAAQAYDYIVDLSGEYSDHETLLFCHQLTYSI